MQIGFLGLLAILFISFKLSGLIAWSWIWVTTPLWIGLAVVLGLFVIGLLAVGIIKMFQVIALSNSKKW